MRSFFADDYLAISESLGRYGQLQNFSGSLGAMFCHPHFRGRPLNDPSSQPHANPPRRTFVASHLWMRWLHCIRLFFYLSTLSILRRAGFSTLTTANSELRLHLLSLHVARLTNLTNPPATNWRDRQQLPNTGSAVHERRIHTRAITHYILPIYLIWRR